MFYLRIKDGWAKALLSRIALIYGGGRNNMNAEKNAEYQYEMVVNIVAEMVIEYLKTTTRAINWIVNTKSDSFFKVCNFVLKWA